MISHKLLHALYSHCIAVAFFLLSAGVYASELSLLAGQERWLYREYNDQEQELDREQGRLDAYQLRARLDFTAEDSLHLGYLHSQGRIDYVGHSQAGEPLTTQTDETSKRGTISLRHRFGWLEIGVGAVKQSWARDIRAGSTQSGTPIAQLYEYYRWSGPLLELSTGYQWHRLQAQILLRAAQLSGDLMIDLTAVPVGNNGQLRNYGKPVLKLTDGYEASTELELRYAITSSWFVLLNYAQTYRAFPQSESVSVRSGWSSFSLHEPRSTNYLYRIDLGLGYRF